jgi:4-hydroxybenzoate polyprenyltransferase
MPLGLGLWLSVALFIIFVRDGIECLANTQSFAIPDGFHLLHVPAFFVSLLIFLIVIVHFFSRTEIQKVSKIALAVFPVIIVPAVFDFIVTLFTKTGISYGYIENDLRRSFLHFFDPFYKIPELPGSVRFEIGGIVLLVFGYIFIKRKHVVPACLGAFSAFVVCFTYVALPAILIGTMKFLAFIINVLHWKNFPFSEGNIDEPLMALMQLLITAVLAVLWFARYDGAACRSMLKNTRLTRTFHYMLLCLLGILTYGLIHPLKDFFALINMASALLSIGLAFQFSVVINDIFDVEGDRISNSDRPLITQSLDKQTYLHIGFVCLALSLLLAAWTSAKMFMILLLFISLYFLYSAPPLRLKRFLPISAFIIGLQALLAFLAGQCALQKGIAHAQLAAPVLSWLVFMVFFLSSHVKDLKDIAGDREMGIPTLPVLLGEKKGRDHIALLVFLSYCLVAALLPIVFPDVNIFVVSLGFALANLIALRKNAQERTIFILYFIYALFLLFSIRSTL